MTTRTVTFWGCCLEVVLVGHALALRTRRLRRCVRISIRGGRSLCRVMPMARSGLEQSAFIQTVGSQILAATPNKSAYLVRACNEAANSD